MASFRHLVLSDSEMGSISNSRLTSVMRWLGLTLVVLLPLQMIGVLSASEWSAVEYQQLIVQRMLGLSPMAFVGLLLVLISSRLDHPGRAQLPVRWLVCGVSSLLAFAMITLIPTVISSNQTLAGQVDQTLMQRRNQVEDMLKQAEIPERLKALGDQLAEAGQLPADATDADKQKAARGFIENQVSQTDQLVKRTERQRNAVINQGLFGGTFSVVVLVVGFVLLALTAVL